MTLDPIALLEQAYRAQPDPQTWLRALAPDVVAATGADWVGGAAYLADPQAPPGQVVPVCREGSPVDADMNLQFARATRRGARRMRAPGIASLHELGDGIPAEIAGCAGVRVGDGAALWTHDGAGRVAVFSSVTAGRLRFDNPTRRLWQRIAIHLGCGCRLVGRLPGPDAPDVEAVIEPSGRVAHAIGPATDAHARDLLRAATTAMDRARARAGRADPMSALGLWRELIDGRWSLVDHFDADGRRYVLARRNAEPVALSRRQREIAFYASVGWSNQEIGYQLGLAENTVSAHLTRSLAAMGVRSRSELVRLSSDVALATMQTRRSGATR